LPVNQVVRATHEKVDPANTGRDGGYVTATKSITWNFHP
jgi:hypothetical protein